MRRIEVGIALLSAAALLVTAAGAPAAKHRRPGHARHPAGRVRSVSNPPASVPSQLKLTRP